MSVRKITQCICIIHTRGVMGRREDDECIGMNVGWDMCDLLRL